MIYNDTFAAIGIGKALGVDERMTEKWIALIFRGNAAVVFLESSCGVHLSSLLRD